MIEGVKNAGDFSGVFHPVWLSIKIGKVSHPVGGCSGGSVHDPHDAATVGSVTHKDVGLAVAIEITVGESYGLRSIPEPVR